MAQTAKGTKMSGREAALARRAAMSSQGKSGLVSNTSTGAPPAAPMGRRKSAGPAAGAVRNRSTGSVGRAASLARRAALSSQGKKALSSSDRVRSAPVAQPVEPREGGCSCGCRAEATTADAVRDNQARHDPPTRRVRAKPRGAPQQRRVNNPTRTAALARRQAQSTRGKAGLKAGATSATSVARAGSGSGLVGRQASLARRAAMSTQGKKGLHSSDRVRNAPVAPRPASGVSQESPPAAKPVERQEPAPSTTPVRERSKPRKSSQTRLANNPTRVAALARRQAQSTRGKAGLNGRSVSAAQTARALNPQLNGRELAQALRAQRSQRGKAGQQKSQPCGRTRPSKAAGPGAAQDAPWKVGASETSSGQTVTGTRVGRSRKATGDEPSTCRSVTGTEYLGAEIFREFCQAEPTPGPRKVRQSATSGGNRVTGNEVGRSPRVTGDEPGTCQRVTGTEYVGADQPAAYCGVTPAPGPAKVGRSESRGGKAVTGVQVGRSSKVTGDEPGAGRELTGSQYMRAGDGQYPPKVGSSRTLRGGAVTGTLTGRSAKVTGDEPGSCRAITGDEYISQEQYAEFCAATPVAQDAKVGVTQTLKGETVTGTLTGRSGKVTGDEPGTCKAITGTPYAGAEQYRSYCEPTDAAQAAAREPQRRATPGAVLTGQQPGPDGTLTGAAKGACETPTGTPYVGADQYAAACPATPAEPGSPDYPQALGDAAPGGGFSISAPSHTLQTTRSQTGVTGTRYEQGQITGPFGMASGKVTGTEEARFNGAMEQPAPLPPTAELVGGRVKSRITGEGMEAGHKITGDDWERGDRVTGTEGTPAMRRNPTRRGGPMSAMPSQQEPKRNEAVPTPESKVTGGSGNTEKGALVTYSGGARG